MSLLERLRAWWRNRPPAEGVNQRPGAYDTRPVYDVPPEDDPGIGGVPGARPVITHMWGFDPHGRGMTRGEMKETIEGAIARAQLDGPQLAELYDLSKTELFSPEGGEIVREVIEARQ